MPFTFYDLIYYTIMMLIYFVVAKLLTQDWKVRLKESVYIVLASLFLGFFSTLILGFSPGFFEMGVLLLIPIGMLYFCSIKSYSVKKALTLIFLMMILSAIGNLISINIYIIFVEVYDAYGHNPIQLSATDLLNAMPHFIVQYGITILITLIFVKLSTRIREIINQSEKAQTVLAVVSVTLIMIMQVSTTIMQFQNEFLDFVTSWEIFFLFGFAATAFISFYFYMKSEQEKMTLRQKESEQATLQYYTQQIERQQTAMRKFKHDYQNILLSINSYVKEKDWDGLTQYMPKVETASAIITKDNFALESLSNIKIPEIKGLLAAKLMMAQNANMSIDTTFEATDEISHIPVDSVALVRMLGIIMDNAVEELEALGEGQLAVSVYKRGGGVTFVIQNTCRPDIQKLQELKQVGFSTKGAGRGLGLNNLAEIADAHPDNISLQTDIKGGSFIQKLRVGGAG